MKKTVKIISILLILLVVATTISSVVFAKVEVDKIVKGIDDASSTATSNIQSMGGKIVNIMQVLGVVIAVVVLVVIGIKYMMGSAEEKAEYKKVMIPYVVGAVLIFGATSIVKVVYEVSTSIKI